MSVYAQLVGSGTRTLLKTAAVDSSGNLAISYPAATRNVIFTATFSGDAQYLARNYSVRAGVAVRVAMTNSGWYTTTKYLGSTFQVFLSTSRLNFHVTVTPSKPAEHVELVGQEWYNNAWTTIPGDVFGFTLNSSSQVSSYLTLTSAAGAYYRVRAVFVPSSSDVTNVSYYSGWFNFEVIG